MKYYGKTLAVTLTAALVSTSALASTATVKNMPDKGHVTLEGTVSSVENAREFTLRDAAGTIDVDIDSNQSVVIKNGDKVTVDGVVDKGITGTGINARSVTVQKNMAEAAGDAIEGNTDISLEGATVYNIENLPDKGLVKISGTVTHVDNEKKFTLKDSTGSINVDIESSETAALTEGAEVTVIGYVDKGMLGKDINANKVLVTASAQPLSDNGE